MACVESFRLYWETKLIYYIREWQIIKDIKPTRYDCCLICNVGEIQTLLSCPSKSMFLS